MDGIKKQVLVGFATTSVIEKYTTFREARNSFHYQVSELSDTRRECRLDFRFTRSSTWYIVVVIWTEAFSTFNSSYGNRKLSVAVDKLLRPECNA